jgi:hypothetical protein
MPITMQRPILRGAKEMQNFTPVRTGKQSKHCLVQAISQKEGTSMAGYTVTALSLDQSKNASQVTVAVSVVDSGGQPIHDLEASSFTARDIATGTPIAITELHYVGMRGFYRLSLRIEPAAGEHIVALVVTGRHQEGGRNPQPLNEGLTMVKVKTAGG